MAVSSSFFLAGFLGMFAALANEAAMPPDAPRLSDGVGFELGAGVPSLDESPPSFLTLEATEPGLDSFSLGSTFGLTAGASALGLAAAGWAFEAAGAPDLTGAGPFRVLRRT